MTKRTYCGLAAFTLATICAAHPAQAANSGFYLGANIGQSNFDIGDTSTAGTGLPSSVRFSKDESDTAWSVLVGYRFVPYVGVEAAYTDYGEATLKSSNSFVISPITITNIDGAIATKGASVALVGMLPVNNWEFSFKLGAFFAKTELSVRIRGRTNFSPTQLIDSSDSESANTAETLAALGIGYTFSEHYHVKLEWTRIPNVGDKDKTGEGDVTSLGLGFHYRF